MSLFVIGDLHLSLGTNKKMDVFRGWENYTERIVLNWKNTVTDSDSVILLGDISWGMTLSEALDDFSLINSLPGKKYIVKGNHDYWWSTQRKIENFFAEHNLSSFSILHNSAVLYDGVGICATRGWTPEDSNAQDKKIITREAMRLSASISAAEALGAEEKIAFLHYPPVYSDIICGEIIEVLNSHGIKKCYYGHIHSEGCKFAIEGNFLGIDFKLVSADRLNFTPFSVL